MKNNNRLLLITAVIVVVCLIIVVVGKSRKKTILNDDTSSEVQESKEEASAAVVAEGQSLIIPVDDITTDVSFIPVEVDGTKMEIIAVRDSAGYIRTAFNTCQICHDSGRGYYVQEGASLVCQNCGNRFTANQIEVESGGCNPWPIFESDKIVTDDSIEISYEFLTASRTVFANWKLNY